MNKISFNKSGISTSLVIGVLAVAIVVVAILVYFATDNRPEINEDNLIDESPALEVLPDRTEMIGGEPTF